MARALDVTNVVLNRRFSQTCARRSSILDEIPRDATLTRAPDVRIFRFSLYGTRLSWLSVSDNVVPRIFNCFPDSTANHGGFLILPSAFIPPAIFVARIIFNVHCRVPIRGESLHSRTIVQPYIVSIYYFAN